MNNSLNYIFLWDNIMLKLKNTFLAALLAVGFTSVIYADNPGEVVATSW